MNGGLRRAAALQGDDHELETTLTVRRAGHDSIVDRVGGGSGVDLCVAGVGPDTDLSVGAVSDWQGTRHGGSGLGAAFCGVSHV